MNKILKRSISMMLALAMVFTMIPSMKAEAAVSYPKKCTVDVTTGDSFGNIHIENAKKTDRVKGLKVSNRSVLSVAGIWYGEWQDEKGKSHYYIDIQLRAFVTGTCDVSYKIGTKSCKTKVTVRPYSNPIKKLKLFGIKENNSTNLASLTKTNAATSLSFDGMTLNKKFELEAAKNWKITSYAVFNLNYDLIAEGGFDNPKSSYKTTLKKMTFDEPRIVEFWFYNTKYDYSTGVKFYIFD